METRPTVAMPLSTATRHVDPSLQSHQSHSTLNLPFVTFIYICSWGRTVRGQQEKCILSYTELLQGISSKISCCYLRFDIDTTNQLLNI